MTVINFSLLDPTEVGVPAVGYLKCTPTSRFVVGTDVRVPSEVIVPLLAGAASSDLQPSGASWCWKITEYVTGGGTRYVIIPATGPVEYTALVDVDPTTLAPAPTGEALRSAALTAAVAVETTRAETAEALRLLASDPSVTNARTPTLHAASHGFGGADSLTVTQAQVTNLGADLGLKAPVASPTFTGTVGGVTKTHVGLGNVDNTSDANKPVSTAQTAAFADKAGTTAALAAIPAQTAAQIAGTYRPTLSHSGFAWYEAGAIAPDTYQSVGDTGQDSGALTGNTGYTRQTLGTPAVHAVQSRMRRCVVKDDASGVRYYLDADNSALIAGTYAAGVQTGWVRVHEGALDPAKTTPGQVGAASTALRSGVPAWDATKTYSAGVRVLYAGSLWDSLSNGNLNSVPAAGTTASVLTGVDGQVMVEIPAFYYRMDYDPARRRHCYEVVFDSSTYRPFPNLLIASALPATVDFAGTLFALHPTFTKAGKRRSARYRSAFQAVAANTADNALGVLTSVADGVKTNSTSISNINFRLKARNRNVGLVDLSGAANDCWSLADYWLLHAIQLLLYTEYRTLYCGAVVGGGNVAGLVYNKITGRTASLGNGSGVTNPAGVAQVPTDGSFDAMTWRGIEDLWGTAWQWMDGWNIRNGLLATEHYLSSTPSTYAYATAAGYELGLTTPKGADAWQYANALTPGAFLLSALGGSTTTYLTDGYYGNAETSGGWRVALVGAGAGFGAVAGVAAVFAGGGAGFVGVGYGAALIL